MNTRNLFVAATLTFLGVAIHTPLVAQETREAQAISRAVYEEIEEARVLSDADDYSGAIRILEKLTADDGLSEYERAYVLQFLAYCHHNNDNTAEAIEIYRAALAIPSLEEQARKQNLYIVVQLLVIEERFDEASATIREWFALEPNPAPNAHALDGQIHYQLGQYREMIAAIQLAIETANERGTEVQEQWYALLSFGYMQFEEYDNLRDVNKTLVAGFPRKRYWMYLAHAYSELNNEDAFLTTYDTAYLQGLLTTESELMTMAQLYLQADVPLKAAQLLEAELDAGNVEETASSMRLLAQAWSLAREEERSLVPLRRAATLDDDGELYVRLGNVLLSLDRNGECIDAVEQGLQKGNLRNPDYAQVSLGMCLFNVREYRDAIRAFRRAAEFPRSTTLARQWIQAAELEIVREREIEKAEAKAREQIEALRNRRAVEAS